MLEHNNYKLSDQFKELLKSIKALGVTRIEVRGSGSGDEGWVEGVSVTPDIDLDLEIPDCCGELESYVTDLAADLGWDYNGDGGHFLFFVDLQANSLSCEVYDYVVESTLSSTATVSLE